MSANPSACGNDTVVISGCPDPIPRLLYAKVTDVSGCSEFDGKIMQLLNDGTSNQWSSDDNDLLVNLIVSGSSRSFIAGCIGGMPVGESLPGDCTTPIDDTFSSVSLDCCGTVDIHIGEVPP